MANAKLKICLLGATGVGKTSLVARFVNSIFSDRYQTTIGVKIEKISLEHRGRKVDLILWDLSGEDEFQSVQPAYLRGAAGYLFVVDGTRRETIQTALDLGRRAELEPRSVACLAALNKSDLSIAWDLRANDEALLRARGWPLVRTSAKTGDGVPRAFSALVEKIFGEAPEAPWI